MEGVHGAGRSFSADTPSETLMPTEPSRDSGCNAKVRPDPPTRTLAPPPTPIPTSPETPTYSPAREPVGAPTVGANTAQLSSPPVVKPRSTPTVLMAPS